MLGSLWEISQKEPGDRKSMENPDPQGAVPAGLPKGLSVQFLDRLDVIVR